ncbi:MAG: hypothetical protein JXQ84_07725, partial [Rhodospirillaceae bacterium]|nr:hypothetical protein [Rhodospirillaceae bacterium]
GSPTNTLLAALSPDACLTVAELATASGMENRAVVKAAAALITRGLAARAEIGCFTLTDEGLVFRAAGQEITSGPMGALTQSYRHRRRPGLQDRLWAALRIKGKASIPELLELAGTGEEKGNSVHKYTAALTKAGYLRELRRVAGTAPTSNGFKRYALIRDTGPEAPQLRTRSHCVYDPNTGEVFSLAGGAA